MDNTMFNEGLLNDTFVEIQRGRQSLIWKDVQWDFHDFSLDFVYVYAMQTL